MEEINTTVTCNDCEVQNTCFDEPIDNPMECQYFENPKKLMEIEVRKHDKAIAEDIINEFTELMHILINLTFSDEKEKEKGHRILDKVKEHYYV